MSWRLRFALAAALALGAYFIYRSFPQDEDAAVRQVLADMAAAAQARDINAFMAHISGDYQDRHNTSKPFIYQMTKRVFDNVDELQVQLSDVDVVITGDTAYLTVSVITVGRSGDRVFYPFGSEDRPERPRITLHKDGAEWEIISVEGVDQGFSLE